MSRDFLPVDAETFTGEIDLFKSSKNSVITEEEYKESKKHLDDIKRQASLQVEGKKLGMINETIENIQTSLKNKRDISNKLNSSDVEIENARDYKMMAEAQNLISESIEKELKMLENLLRIDSADSGGTAMQTQIMIKTMDRNGNETNAFVGINNG